MSPEVLPWATIAGMAAVTYATRVAGYLLLAAAPDAGLLRRILERVPGATFAALVAPRLATAPADQWLAAAVLALALWRGGPFLAILGYVATLALLRALAP